MYNFVNQEKILRIMMSGFKSRFPTLNKSFLFEMGSIMVKQITHKFKHD